MALTRRSLSLLILFLSAVVTLFGDSVPLPLLLEETGARLQWEPYRKIGLLVKGNDYLLFRPDQNWVLLNYAIRKTVEPVTQEEGKLLFPESTAKEIRSFLGYRHEGIEVPRITTIFIDPGHGGRDTGAVASHVMNGKTVQLVEKDIVLDVSREVDRLLRNRFPEKTVQLTRETDSYPSLEDRVEMANGIPLAEREAIIYISIHANASPFNRKANGFEVWYLPPEYRRELVDANTLEGESTEILPILNTMLEEEYTIKSILLARNILAGMDAQIGKESPSRGLKEQSWYVVRNAKMPSVLVEIGFITNEPEAALLTQPEYLRKIANGIYNGIVSFIDYFEQAEFASE